LCSCRVTGVCSRRDACSLRARAGQGTGEGARAHVQRAWLIASVDESCRIRPGQPRGRSSETSASLARHPQRARDDALEGRDPHSVTKSRRNSAGCRQMPSRRRCHRPGDEDKRLSNQLVLEADSPLERRAALRLAVLAPFDVAQGAPSSVEGLRAFDLSDGPP